MTPVDVSAVTAAVVNRLRDQLPEANVTRSDVLNTSPSLCPWVGVYRQEVRYPIRSMGSGQATRTQRIDLVAVVQEQDATSGEQCEDRLEVLIRDVITGLFVDQTFGSTVDVVDELVVRYTNYEKQDAAYMQTAFVYFTLITKVY